MDDSWQGDIRSREEENRLAFLGADLDALDRLWTDDLLVNSPINTVNTKRATLALLQAGRIRHTSLSFEIEQLARHGDVVVVMGRDRVTDGPDDVVSHRRFTNAWRREDGAWRCFARHANVVRAGLEPPTGAR